MKKTTKLMVTIGLTALVMGCTGLPKLSLTPVSVSSEIGGEHDTASETDSVIGVTTGETANYVADTVEQVYTEVHEYPLWLVMAFALAVGVAVPSPTNAWSHWRRRRSLEKTNKQLMALLERKEPV